MIFQEYALVERLTVMENVLSGRLGYVGFWRSYFRRFPRSDIDEAFRLLERVGLDRHGRQACRRAVRRAATARRHRPCADPGPGAAARGRADRQPRSQDLAADHALIWELCDERDLAAIINIHDVPAGADVRRSGSSGCSSGKSSTTVRPDGLTPDVLTEIYGEEDWEATIEHWCEDEDDTGRRSKRRRTNRRARPPILTRPPLVPGRDLTGNAA